MVRLSRVDHDAASSAMRRNQDAGTVFGSKSSVATPYCTLLGHQHLLLSSLAMALESRNDVAGRGRRDQKEPRTAMMQHRHLTSALLACRIHI